jgi:GWxTD domain-containing protein
MKRTGYWCVVALLSSLCNLSAQEVIKGSGDFRIAFDMARYYGDESKVFIELYYGIHENAVTYSQVGGQYAGNVTMKYVLRNDSQVVATKEWAVPHTLEDSSQLPKARMLTGLETVALLPGQYSITFSAVDANARKRKDSITTAFSVALFSKDKEAFSDIELCTSIRSSSEQQSLFYKNTLEVVPNAGRLFGTGLPIMYYYVEVYNLSLGQSQSSITVHTAVVDAVGKEVQTHDKLKPRLHESSVEIGTMNLSALKSGTYLFRVSLFDSMKTEIVSTSKKFFVYKLGSLPDTIDAGTDDFMSSEYVFKSEAEVDKDFQYAKYIATEHERNQFEMLTDLKAKQRFMHEFWERHDTGTGGSQSFKKNYFKRVDYANNEFSVGVHEGWKTDRGRVYVIYGQCDEIERFPNTADTNPYEIWHYNNLQGGVVFVFVDRENSGHYTLVHSTHDREFRDDNWYQTYALKAE